MVKILARLSLMPCYASTSTSSEYLTRARVQLGRERLPRIKAKNRRQVNLAKVLREKIGESLRWREIDPGRR
eukprot:scaffold8416_cov91-Skeletonema_dohrnii-CCMP3373.AAC.3